MARPELFRKVLQLFCLCIYCRNAAIIQREMLAIAQSPANYLRRRRAIFIFCYIRRRASTLPNTPTNPQQQRPLLHTNAAIHVLTPWVARSPEICSCVFAAPLSLLIPYDHQIHTTAGKAGMWHVSFCGFLFFSLFFAELFFINHREMP